MTPGPTVVVSATCVTLRMFVGFERVTLRDVLCWNVSPEGDFDVIDVAIGVVVISVLLHGRRPGRERRLDPRRPDACGSRWERVGAGLQPSGLAIANDDDTPSAVASATS